MLILLLPAFNECEALKRLIPEAGAALKAIGRPHEILVVNDGSTDSTSALIQELSKEWPVRELRHDSNRGYGAALSTGYEWILDHAGEDDAVFSMDADNSHPPRYIAGMLRKLDAGCNVVTASYAQSGGKAFGVPPVRRAASAACNGLFRLAFPIRGIRTYTNGYRAYRVSALRQAAAKWGRPLIKEGGFPGGVELFLKVVFSAGHAGEVPFELHYENRGSGSKIRFLHTMAGYLRLLGCLRVRLWRRGGV